MVDACGWGIPVTTVLTTGYDGLAIEFDSILSQVGTIFSIRLSKLFGSYIDIQFQGSREQFSNNERMFILIVCFTDIF